ncbi:MAG: acyl-CoA synthetase FdrA [Thermodesulfobacteriota bacterium]
MIIKTEIMPSFYQDSVILMRIAGKLRQRPGVKEAALFMGTPSNHELLGQIGLSTAEGVKASANDLIVTIAADTETVADDTIIAAKELLAERRQAMEESQEYRPRTLDSAVRLMPNANLVSISIPGAYARFEAIKALRRDLHVFLFSDNVPIEAEVELKQEAVKRGLFCMGPDQGTAYINGVGLGFANVVPRGRIGCVSASGTGLQAVAARVSMLGEGISHGIGVGGRDLSRQVGGLMTSFAFEALAQDAATEVVILVSKPICAAVKPKIKEIIQKLKKPVVICCIGTSDFNIDGAISARTLDEAADAAVAVLREQPWQPKCFTEHQVIKRKLSRMKDRDDLAGSRILGLYTGGTLAYESHLLLEGFLGPVGYNQPESDGHSGLILDLGDDVYTIGRPHPMIDPQKRTEMILEMGKRNGANILLLDLVLGKGSHENPAEPLAAAVKVIHKRFVKAGRPFAALASVIGTEMDPQDMKLQIKQLQDAEIDVFPSNAEAARFAALLVNPGLHNQFMEHKS